MAAVLKGLVKKATQAAKKAAKADEAVEKVVNAQTKKSTKKRGRKGKGRKPIPEADKRAAKAAGYTSVKKWKEAGSPKPEKKKSSRPKKLSKRWERVKKSQERQMRGEGESRIGARGKTYVNDPTDVGEGPNTFPLSKHELPFDKISPARRRQLIQTGQAMPTKKGVTKKNPSGLKKTGRFAEIQENVMEEMGFGGRGIIDEDEIIELGGFQIAKGGGQIKYKKKGGPIGVGAARAGFGKVRS